MRDGKVVGWDFSLVLKMFCIEISPAHCPRKGYFFSDEKKQNSSFFAQVLWAQIPQHQKIDSADFY
jgi:hypothetical protein